jgi:RNA polymerase sigma-70 factor (ECF subfamily)
MWLFQEEQNAFSHLSDGDLVQQVLAGEERAFDALVRRYASFLFKRITSRLRDYDTACDVFQQVLIQLYRSLSSLDQQRPLKPWLAQVTRSKVSDEMRRTRWIFLSEDPNTEEDPWLLLPDPSLAPEAQVEQRELRSHVKEAIARLPQRYQQVVLLRYLTELPFSAIGRLIGIPEATAKTHFQRARPLLRAALRAEQMTERSLEADNMHLFFQPSVDP